MKVDLEAFLKEVPPILHPGLRQSRYFTSKSQSLVITSEESRNQHDNQEKCKVKLHDLIREVGRESVPGETSVETRQRVQRL